jgi:hypothetical protein
MTDQTRAPRVLASNAPEALEETVEAELTVPYPNAYAGDWLNYLTVQIARDSRFSHYFDLIVFQWQSEDTATRPGGLAKGTVQFRGVRANKEARNGS